MKPTSTDTQQIERAIKGQPMASEQAADLAALQAAAMTDADAGGVQQQAPAEPQGPDLAAEFQGIITVVVQTLGPMFPSLPELYTDQTKNAVAQAVAAVCNKHGWLQGGMFGEYGEEIACVAVCAPLAIATYKGVQGDLAKHKAKHEAKQLEQRANLSAPAPATAAPSSKAVTFGAQVEEAAA